METNEDFSKYIGIPYKFNGCSYKGCDCGNLVRLFYKEHGWKGAEYEMPKHTNWYEEDPLAMQRYLIKHFDMVRDVSQAEFGDIMYFLINGEGHLGIVLPYGKILMTYPPINKFNGGVSFIDRYKY